MTNTAGKDFHLLYSSQYLLAIPSTPLYTSGPGNIASTMPSYFLPYPKTKPTHVKKKQKPPPLNTTQKVKNPYPHPQPDPPNNPPSPLNLSPTSSSPVNNLSSSSSSSSSSTIPTMRSASGTSTWHQDYHPSGLRLEIVCGDPHAPSFVVVFGLRFREGRRPKVKFSVKRGGGKDECFGFGQRG